MMHTGLQTEALVAGRLLDDDSISEVVVLTSYFQPTGFSLLVQAGRNVHIFSRCREWGENGVIEPQASLAVQYAEWSSSKGWGDVVESTLQRRSDKGGATALVLFGGIHLLHPASIPGLQSLGVRVIYCLEGADWHRYELSSDFYAKLGRSLDRVSLGARRRRALVRWLGKVFLKLFSEDLHDMGVGQYTHDQGACYKAFLPDLCERVHRRRGALELALFEESLMLEGAVPHELIRKWGEGRSCVWERDIYFSSSDGSDPNVNGRRYRMVLGGAWKSALWRWLFARPELEVQALREGTTSELSLKYRSTVCHTVLSKERSALLSLSEQTLRTALRYERSPVVSGSGVLFFTSHLGAGGAERQMVYTARELAARGVAVGVLTQSLLHGDTTHYLDQLESAALPVTSLPRYARDEQQGHLCAELLGLLTPTLAQGVRSLVTLLEVSRPAVLHCWLDMPNVIGAFAGLLAGVPRIILSFRNLNPTHFDYIHEPWLRMLYQIVLEDDRVHCTANSRAGAESYSKWLGIPGESCKVIYNGIDHRLFERSSAKEIAAFREECGVPVAARVVGGVFRLSAEKAPLRFLAVVKELLAKDASLYVVLCGVGSMEDQVRSFVQEHSLDRVRLLGRRTDIPRVLSACDLLLLTSDFEGLPNVLMEAQSLGVPVVTTAAGGAAEVIAHGQDGFVVEAPFTVGKLVRKCRDVLGNPALAQQMSACGLERSRQRFSQATMLRNTRACYGEIAPGMPFCFPAPTVRENSATLTSLQEYHLAHQDPLHVRAAGLCLQAFETVDMLYDTMGISRGERLTGKSLVQLGCRGTQEVALVLAGLGADVLVVTSCKMHWDEVIHTMLLRILQELANERYFHFFQDPVERVWQSRCYHASPVRLVDPEHYSAGDNSDLIYCIPNCKESALLAASCRRVVFPHEHGNVHIAVNG